jgi:superfamily I DNA/RNA helicase
LVKANNYSEENKWLITSSKEYAQAGYAPAILIPRHQKIFEFLQNILASENKPLMPQAYSNNNRENYELINDHLKNHSIKFQYLGNGAGSFEKATTNNLVTVMTYHSAKGLDFKAVFVPFLTAELEIWRDDETKAKTLFFVAVTRSREQLFLSYNGNTKHRFLNLIPQSDFNTLNAADEVNRMNNPLGANGDDNEPLIVF